MGRGAGVLLVDEGLQAAWACRTASARCVVPGFHGANDEEADLDWLDEQFGRSPGKWTNSLIFQWDWDTWRTNTKATLDLTKYPKQAPDELMKSATGGAISSTADWEKKAQDLRKTVTSMLGTEPPIVVPEARGAFPGGVDCAASRGCRSCCSAAASTWRLYAEPGTGCAESACVGDREWRRLVWMAGAGEG